MKKSSRYLLIGLGFAVFFILAPLLILYVSGTTVNLGDGAANSTGILDAKSEPSSATVYINDEEKGTTPATIRFLTQGEYLVKLTKNGYYDWAKRLPIESGQVMFTQEGVEVVQLIKKAEAIIIEQSGVSNFLLVDNTIWYVKGTDIVYASVTDPAKKTVIANVLSKPSTLFLLRDRNHILIPTDTESILINANSKAITKLPIKVSHEWQVQIPSEDIAIYQSGSKIYSYNLIAKNTVELATEVRAMTMLGTTVYLARTNGTVSSSIWNGTSFTDEQIITSGVPVNESNVSLIITDRKELFLNNGTNGFYRVGPELTSIVSHVDKAQLDPITNELTLQISGELWFYNFLTNKPQLLTRSTEQVNSFIIRSSIGYGFIGNSLGLEIIEVDTRDKQNRYQILSGKQVYQLAITENQKTALALQDGALKMIEIRD